MKNKARETSGKKRRETGGKDDFPRFFPTLSLALFFARPERLEQAKEKKGIIYTNLLPNF